MPQKFAFTTAAMAAALEETPVSYEDLADIERDFDEAETDISEFHPARRVMRKRSCIIISDRSLPPPTNNSRTFLEHQLPLRNKASFGNIMC